MASASCSVIAFCASAGAIANEANKLTTNSAAKVACFIFMVQLLELFSSHRSIGGNLQLCVKALCEPTRPAFPGKSLRRPPMVGSDYCNYLGGKPWGCARVGPAFGMSLTLGDVRVKSTMRFKADVLKR